MDNTSGEQRLGSLEAQTSSERLLPELRDAFHGLGWKARDLGAVGVVAGPGSFTGARIGLAAAKGLCESTGASLVLVSRLAVLAEAAAPGTSGPVHALLRAGRGEIFYGRFAPHEAPLEALLSRDAVLAATSTGLLVACEAELPAELGARSVLLIAPLTAPDALPLVLARLRQGDVDDIASTDANYVRRTETEMLQRLAQRAAAT